MVKMKTIEAQFNVHVMLIKGKYHAFRGGYGTGHPVVDIASAFRTDTLYTRVAKALSHENNNQNSKGKN